MELDLPLSKPTDDPVSQTVVITATDSEGASNQVSFELQVNNVAPEIFDVACDATLANPRPKR